MYLARKYQNNLSWAIDDSQSKWEKGVTLDYELNIT